MEKQKEKISDGRIIQATGWLGLYVISVLFFLPLKAYTFSKALVAPMITVGGSALIVYANVLWLIPAFYEKRKYVVYGLLVIALLVGGTALRVFASYEILNGYFRDINHDYSAYQWGATLLKSITVLLVSILFYTMIRYFKLRKRHEEIESQRYKAELDLLKASVQPHFLFNTLNNIYYETNKESPRAAALVEKLSVLMRYFVDENPKEKVCLEKELEFITNYIDLERIRIRYPLHIVFQQPTQRNITLPPMLLMPFVENLFKHGIDKDKAYNYAKIDLEIKSGSLHFSVINTLHPTLVKTESGLGLENLRKRLQVLYGKNFTLQAAANGNQYESNLIIPLE